MKKLKSLFIVTTIVCQLVFINTTNAQNIMKTENALDKKEQSIVTIAAFTAQGNMQKLQAGLNTGLNAGLTINEIKEVLVQLYAYCGFPRSLNALSNFMAVLNERKQKGINDVSGKTPDALPNNQNQSKIEFGTAIQTQLIGQPVSGEVFAFAPAIDTFLKEHLFGDIFGRNNLNWRTRELATVSALAAMDGTDNQLRSHFGIGMHNGLTEAQLQQVVSIIQTSVGTKEGEAANKVLQQMLQQNQTNNANKETSANNTSTKNITMNKQEINVANDNETGNENLLFTKGDKLSNDYFTGNAFLHTLVPKDENNAFAIGSVTFQPGARTNWHTHPKGQVLIVTDGNGFYQEKGKPAQPLQKGSVVNIPAYVEHWHGASAGSKLVHIAITNYKEDQNVVWLQPVSDEEYAAVNK